MRPLVGGFDIGGTKIHFAAEYLDGATAVDEVYPSEDWLRLPYSARADRIAELATLHASADRFDSLVLGVNGCDTDAQADAFREHLVERLPSSSIRVVNDAFLLGPAMGEDHAVQLIAGTGSIAVGRRPNGEAVYAGGWGRVIGDEGGAAGIVRHALRGLARGFDERALDGDPLLDQLLDESGLPDIHALAAAIARDATVSGWSEAVFTAQSRGSRLADTIIRDNANELVRLVHCVIDGGARATRVIAAGSVMTEQPGFAGLVSQELSQRFGLTLEVLDVAPVRGAVRMAHDLHRSRERPPASTTAPPRVDASTANHTR